MKTGYICEICGFGNEDKSVVEQDEKLCLLFKESKDRIEKERKASGQLTLGEIIERSEKLLPSYSSLNVIITVEEADEYRYSVPENSTPELPHSYRGDYSELAIDFSSSGKNVTLSEFINKLRSAVRSTYSGWKGGDYTMTEDTFVWISPQGISTRIGVVDIRLSPNQDCIHLCGKQF